MLRGSPRLGRWRSLRRRRGVCTTRLRSLASCRVAAAMLRLMDSLKTFDQIYVTTQGGPGIASQTLNLYIFEPAFQYLNFGYASALLVVLFFVILAGNLVLVTQRRGQT